MSQTQQHYEEMPASVALMVDQNDAADADLLLQEFDFPENYVNMAHPNDGTITSTPYYNRVHSALEAWAFPNARPHFSENRR